MQLQTRRGKSWSGGIIVPLHLAALLTQQLCDDELYNSHRKICRAVKGTKEGNVRRMQDIVDELIVKAPGELTVIRAGETVPEHDVWPNQVPAILGKPFVEKDSGFECDLGVTLADRMREGLGVFVIRHGFHDGWVGRFVERKIKPVTLSCRDTLPVH